MAGQKKQEEGTVSLHRCGNDRVAAMEFVEDFSQRSGFCVGRNAFTWW